MPDWPSCGFVAAVRTGYLPAFFVFETVSLVLIRQGGDMLMDFAGTSFRVLK